MRKYTTWYEPALIQFTLKTMDPVVDSSNNKIYILYLQIPDSVEI